MALDDILSRVPIDDIAAQLGVSHAEAKAAVQQGGAVLLSGLAKNAETDSGSAAIENALKKHKGATGASKVDDIDQKDGGKIVSHILGAKEKEVTTTLNESKATAGIDFGKLLPILAPIVMGLIANATKDKSGTKTADAGTQGAQGSGGIGDLIGGILGGGSGSGGGGLGDVLGGVLGGLLGGKR